MNRNPALLFAILAFIYFLPSELFSQISGISASKSAAINVFPIPQKYAELEPTFNYSRSKYDFDGDSILLSSSISWRLTYGLTKEVELGLNTSSDFSTTCLSTKVQAYQKDKLALGAMAGFGMNLGNRVSGSDKDFVTGYGAGIIASYDLNPKNSIDLNLQYYKNIGSFDSFIINAEIGSYVLHEKWQLIFGFGYQTTSANPIVTLYPGLAIESAKNFILVFAPAITISGADLHTNPQTFGFGLSFTGIWH